MASTAPTLEAAHGQLLYLGFRAKNVASDGRLQRLAENEPVFLIA